MKINSARRFIKSSKGFTLIELLIVIAIIGILAAALLIAIDPAEKIRLANDTRAMNNVSEVSNKIEQWAVQYNDGVYPTNAGGGWNQASTASASNPNSPSSPVAPTSSYAFVYNNNGNNTFYVRVQSLQSKKYNANPAFIYDSAKGKTCPAAAGATTCP